VTPISHVVHYNIQLPIIDIVALLYLVEFLAEERDRMILLAQHTTYAYAGGVTSPLKYFREIKKGRTRAGVNFSLISSKALVAALVHLNSPFLKHSVIGAMMTLKPPTNLL